MGTTTDTTNYTIGGKIDVRLKPINGSSTNFDIIIDGKKVPGGLSDNTDAFLRGRIVEELMRAGTRYKVLLGPNESNPRHLCIASQPDKVSVHGRENGATERGDITLDYATTCIQRLASQFPNAASMRPGIEALRKNRVAAVTRQ